MIPRRAGDLDALLTEVVRQRDEVTDLFASLPADAARMWRPDEARWSATGHIAHLGIINEAYLGAIASVVEGARAAGGPMSDGPYRHPRIASWFVKTMEPPPKKRMKTFSRMVPDPGTTPEAALADFGRLQGRMAELIEASRGLDLGRVRFGSPFLSVLRFSLGTGFEMLLAHDRRHIWLVHELLALPGAPTS